MVSKKIINIIKIYIKELITKDLQIKKVYLYGSYAKGTASVDSDIDLAIISPQFDSDSDKYAPVIWLSDYRAEHKIEPITIGEERFKKDDVSPLLEIVRKEGIEITF